MAHNHFSPQYEYYYDNLAKEDVVLTSLSSLRVCRSACDCVRFLLPLLTVDDEDQAPPALLSPPLPLRIMRLSPLLLEVEKDSRRVTYKEEKKSQSDTPVKCAVTRPNAQEAKHVL